MRLPVLGGSGAAHVDAGRLFQVLQVAAATLLVGLGIACVAVCAAQEADDDHEGRHITPAPLWKLLRA